MKYFNLSLLLLTLAMAAPVAAQTPSAATDAPGVAVTGHRWRQVVRNPVLDEDPLRANDEHRELMRAQQVIARENRIRERGGQTPLPPPRIISNGAMVGDHSVSFAYEINLRNTGAKEIRAIVWEYVFFLPDTQRVIGNHRFTTEVNLRPDRSKRLVERSTFPPARSIDATQAGELSERRYAERVVIHRINYTDGSFWERPAN